jgi:hypothetical protein
MKSLLVICFATLLACESSVVFASQRRYPPRIVLDVEQELLKAIKTAPVHQEIMTTVFWVGELAKPNSGWSDNLDSAWDMRWKENFGGLDSPVKRKGFSPAKFRPRQNPFYVALPFNDINNPDYLEMCPLLQFFKIRKASRVHSVCKNRWIEIAYKRKVCYAQWQDVGPFCTDDYDYVFKGEEPKEHQRDMAGLDISPAVRDYLSFSGSDRTSWRFVDDSKVAKGPWNKVVTRS